jgi:hypothetical protein
MGNAGATPIVQAAVLLLQMAETVILARLLMPGDFGVVAIRQFRSSQRYLDSDDVPIGSHT